MHIKAILKDFFKNRPVEGEDFDKFLNPYVERILNYSPPDLHEIQKIEDLVEEDKSRKKKFL